jgi:hypothetical protein
MSSSRAGTRADQVTAGNRRTAGIFGAPDRARIAQPCQLQAAQHRANHVASEQLLAHAALQDVVLVPVAESNC